MSIGVVSKRSIPPQLGGDSTIGRTVRPEPEFAKTKSSTSVGRRSAARASRFSSAPRRRRRVRLLATAQCLGGPLAGASLGASSVDDPAKPRPLHMDRPQASP